MGGGFHLYRAHVCVEYGAEALCATFYFEEILWRRHMKLVIYKGFDKNFLSQLEATPLVNTVSAGLIGPPFRRVKRAKFSRIKKSNASTDD